MYNRHNATLRVLFFSLLMPSVAAAARYRVNDDDEAEEERKIEEVLAALELDFPSAQLEFTNAQFVMEALHRQHAWLRSDAGERTLGVCIYVFRDQGGTWIWSSSVDDIEQSVRRTYLLHPEADVLLTHVYELSIYNVDDIERLFAGAPNDAHSYPTLYNFNSRTLAVEMAHEGFRLYQDGSDYARAADLMSRVYAVQCESWCWIHLADILARQLDRAAEPHPREDAARVYVSAAAYNDGDAISYLRSCGLDTVQLGSSDVAVHQALVLELAAYWRREAEVA